MFLAGGQGLQALSSINATGVAMKNMLPASSSMDDDNEKFTNDVAAAAAPVLEGGYWFWLVSLPLAHRREACAQHGRAAGRSREGSAYVSITAVYYRTSTYIL